VVGGWWLKAGDGQRVEIKSSTFEEGSYSSRHDMKNAFILHDTDGNPSEDTVQLELEA